MDDVALRFWHCIRCKSWFNSKDSIDQHCCGADSEGLGTFDGGYLQLVNDAILPPAKVSGDSFVDDFTADSFMYMTLLLMAEEEAREWLDRK